MKLRIPAIDIAKSIAILLVVVGHVSGYCLYGFNGGAVFRESPWVNFIYSFHMPLFFLLSGLVVSIPKSWSQVPADLLKRTKMLLLPALLVGALFSLLFTDIAAFLPDMMKQGYWFLFVLYVYYLLHYAMTGVDGRRYFACIYAVYLAFVYVALRLLTRYLPDSVYNYICLGSVANYFPFFFAGQLIRLDKNWSRWLDNPYLSIACLTCIAAGYLYSYPYLYFVHAFSCSVLVLQFSHWLSRWKGWMQRLMLLVGGETLYIYIFHYFIVQLLIVPSFMSWWKLHGNGWLELLVSVPLSMVIIALCVVVHRSLNKSFSRICSQ